MTELADFFLRYAPVINLVLIAFVFVWGQLSANHKIVKDLVGRMEAMERNHAERHEQVQGLRRDVDRALDHIFHEVQHDHDPDGRTD